MMSILFENIIMRKHLEFDVHSPKNDHTYYGL